MFSKHVTLLVSIFFLSGCVMVPEIEFAETLQFDQPAPAQQPVNYADLLCCFDCTV